MKILIFLARITLICNISYLLSQFLRYINEPGINAVYSTVIILGYCSLFLNIIFAVIVVVTLLTRKSALSSFPNWLMIVIFVFLMLQLIIILHDS